MLMARAGNARYPHRPAGDSSQPTRRPPQLPEVMALADRYGLQGGQPDWLADLIARYHLTPPSGPERPVIGGIGQRILDQAALASALCGLAPTAAALVAARLAQGIGGALIAPNVLSIIGVAYPGPARVRAITIDGMVMGLAAAGGQLIGGVLIAADPLGLGWRAVFLVNVPVCLAALAGAPRLVGESRGSRASSLDVRGMALVDRGSGGAGPAAGGEHCAALARLDVGELGVVTGPVRALCRRSGALGSPRRHAAA
jgi:MFS family permease